jgi:hypothetical protein
MNSPSPENVDPRPSTSGGVERPHSRRLPVGWMIAAALFALSAWLCGLNFTLRTQNRILRDELQLTELEMRGLRQQLDAERILARHLDRPSDSPTETPKPAPNK